MKTDGLECKNFDCPFHDTLMEFSCSASDQFEEPSIETCRSAILEQDTEKLSNDPYVDHFLKSKVPMG